jgi:hypothetical protein
VLVPRAPNPPLLPHRHLLYHLVHHQSPSSFRAISRSLLSRNAALSDYSKQYETARSTYLEAAKALKMATGPYKATRDAYVAAGVFRQAALLVRECGVGGIRRRSRCVPIVCLDAANLGGVCVRVYGQFERFGTFVSR